MVKEVHLNEVAHYFHSITPFKRLLRLYVTTIKCDYLPATSQTKMYFWGK